MSYKSLLFCPDEKTARIVTQVLTEVDFQVEACNEPFAAVKKLTTEHFDALVVDCDNEQNASLLFKSARNSEFNQNSLAVAVVEGQSGVAKAFRIGANLVLTKPINVEQSKGTLRVARGLLRKTGSAKAAAAPPSVDQIAKPAVASDVKRPPVANVPAPKPASAFMQPPPQVPAPPVATASVFECEEEPAPKPEPADAELLDSMPDPVSGKSHASETKTTPGPSKQYPWQPVAKPMAEPMATALRRAAEAAGKASSLDASLAPTPASATSDRVSPRIAASQMSSSGSAAAPAPAKEASPTAEVTFMPQVEPPTFATSIGSGSATDGFEAGGSKKILLIAAIVLLAAAGTYFGRTRIGAALNLAHKPATPVQSPAPVHLAVPSAAGLETSVTNLSSTPSAEVTATPLPPSSQKSPAAEASSSAVKKSIPSPATPEPDKDIVEESAPEALIVNRGAARPVAPAPSPEVAPPPAPGALSLGSDAASKSISGLINVPASVPRVAPQTLKVSQGVSQGLLVKKVPPVYPPQAMQMRIQGAVEIMATIGKDGSITNVKLLSGDAVLAQAAMEAVKQWMYKPYYLDGQPVAIQTQIIVNFKLP